MLTDRHTVPPDYWRIPWVSDALDHFGQGIGDYFSGGSFEDDAKKAAEKFAREQAAKLAAAARAASPEVDAAAAAVQRQAIIDFVMSPVGLLSIAVVLYLIFRRKG